MVVNSVFVSYWFSISASPTLLAVNNGGRKWWQNQHPEVDNYHELSITPVPWQDFSSSGEFGGGELLTKYANGHDEL